jgi:hypothetical protein
MAKERLVLRSTEDVELDEDSNKDQPTTEVTRDADELNADAARGCMKINKFFAAAPPAAKSKGMLLVLTCNWHCIKVQRLLQCPCTLCSRTHSSRRPQVRWFVDFRLGHLCYMLTETWCPPRCQEEERGGRRRKVII